MFNNLEVKLLLLNEVEEPEQVEEMPEQEAEETEEETRYRQIERRIAELTKELASGEGTERAGEEIEKLKGFLKKRKTKELPLPIPKVPLYTLAHYKGMAYKATGKDPEGDRVLLGLRNKVAGRIKPDDSLEVWGPGEPESKYREKTGRGWGWEVIWGPKEIEKKKYYNSRFFKDKEEAKQFLNYIKMTDPEATLREVGWRVTGWDVTWGERGGRKGTFFPLEVGEDRAERFFNFLKKKELDAKMEEIRGQSQYPVAGRAPGVEAPKLPEREKIRRGAPRSKVKQVIDPEILKTAMNLIRKQQEQEKKSL